MNLKKQMDSLYREISLEEIPWNLESPPDMLLQLVDSGKILPCAVVDLGCGAGNYAVWLATQGFQVTGVDISPKALELAQQLAVKKDVSCRFLVADLLGNLSELEDSFDFGYDWEVFHHVFPENRGRYVANVHRILRRGGRYLSVCFSEDDSSFGQKGKYRRTPLGTTLYFSSERELRDLFEPIFTIEELSTIEIAGKYTPHLAVKALLVKSE